jgi:hypothetical protein
MLCIRAVLSPCDLSSQPTDAEEGGKVQGKRLKESGEVTWHASKLGKQIRSARSRFVFVLFQAVVHGRHGS